MFTSFNARAVGLDLARPPRRSSWPPGPASTGSTSWSATSSTPGDDPAEVRARMDDLGLRGGAFPLPVAWRGDEADVPPRPRRAPRLAEAAAILGLTRTGTWVMPETPGRDSAAAEVAALHVERLGEIARVLGRHGIRLGLEVIGVESFRTGTRRPVRRPAGRPRPGAGPDLGRGARTWASCSTPSTSTRPASRSRRAGLGRRAGGLGPRRRPARPAAVDDRSQIVDADAGLPGENGAVDVRGFLRPVERARLRRAGHGRAAGRVPVARGPGTGGGGRPGQGGRWMLVWPDNRARSVGPDQ